MKIAFFDFDGTITNKDTLLEVIKFQKGEAALRMGFLLNLPFLIALKLKLISNQAVKERILKYYFSGVDAHMFMAHCDEFAMHALPAMIRTGALVEIEKLKNLKFEIVIVSASADSWIKAWSDRLGLKLIATQLEIVNDKITGKIEGLNCNGEEKVRRIKTEFDLEKYETVYCYGDTDGDKPMLALGTKAFFKPFR